MAADSWGESSGATTVPIPSSDTTRAISDSGSATARIGFPAAITLYILLGTDTPAIPLRNEISAISQALRYASSSSSEHGGRTDTLVSPVSATLFRRAYLRNP